MSLRRALFITATVSSLALTATAQTPRPLGGPKATILFLAPYGKPFRLALDGPIVPTALPSQVWFKETDTNQDATLSEDEFNRASLDFFDEVDLNHDGVISDPENRNYENKIVPELIGPINMPQNMAGQDRRGGPPPGGGMGGGGMRGPNGGSDGLPSGGKGGGGDFTPMTNSRGAEPFSLMKEPQAIRASDANFDYRITRDEWINANQERFDVLDKDHDRQLRLTELPQTQIEQRLLTPPDPKEMKKKRKPPLER